MGSAPRLVVGVQDEVTSWDYEALRDLGFEAVYSGEDLKKALSKGDVFYVGHGERKGLPWRGEVAVWDLVGERRLMLFACNSYPLLERVRGHSRWVEGVGFKGEWFVMRDSSLPADRDVAFRYTMYPVRQAALAFKAGNGADGVASAFEEAVDRALETLKKLPWPWVIYVRGALMNNKGAIRRVVKNPRYPRVHAPQEPTPEVPAAPWWVEAFPLLVLVFLFTFGEVVGTFSKAMAGKYVYGGEKGK